MRRTALLLALILGVACTPDADPGDADAGSSPDRPPSATLIGRNLELFPGADQAIRFGVTPFGRAVRMIASFEPRNAEMDLCPIERIEDPAPEDRAGCLRSVRSGVRESVSAAGIRGVAVVLRSSERVDLDVVLEYEEGERDIGIHLPVIPSPPGGVDCSDNACNPFFVLQPTRAGSFEATAGWDGPDGVLVLLQGSVLARAETATGVRYAEPARAEGPSPLRVATRLSAPAEYALALRHTRQGAAIPAMRAVTLQVSWP